MNRVLVIYDISHDRTRLKISETCLDYGLDRYQFSVFSGLLKPIHVRELTKTLSAIVKKQPGRVMIMKVAADEWAGRTEVGEAEQ